MDQILPLLVAIPLGAAFLIPILVRVWRRFPDILGNLSTLALLVMSLLLVGREPSTYYMGGWRPPLGINLVADGLSVLLLIVISSIAFCATLFSIPYMEKYTSKSRYYSLFMLMVAGMNGVVLTGDMFNLYVFLEIASIASYALVAFGTEAEELEASFKYMIMGCVASTFVLFGVGILYGRTGTLNMAHLARIVDRDGMSPAILFASALFLMGFGLKAGMVPFHAWLPDAHPAAPAPISAMLSGVLIKAIGMYAIARFFYVVFGMDGLTSTVFMALGLLSMVVGALLAVGQWDFKRLLAYSSISQMGYVMLGLGIGTPLGVLGALFHLLNHATFKGLLFLCSGAIEHGTGTRDMGKMGGLIRGMPLTGTTCSVGSLSISGIPPFNGFWSKLIIIVAAVQAGHYAIAAVVVLLSFLTLTYYLRLMRHSIFGDLPEALKGIREAPALMGIPLVLLAVCCLSLGLLYPVLKPLLLGPATDVLLRAGDYIDLVLGG
ncbi:MAG TPA: monovalent cation/H+ antiporter subunit D family protein [Candidatus Latescibacteria bacterium]|nr:monovalent cation/H+ antiporter subunit D family protein [Candidatus Latescibacterota bacterium]